MDVSKLIRDPSKVKEALKEVDDTLIATKPMKIYFPEHYFNFELAAVDSSIKICAINGMVVDNYYAVNKACALMQTEPSSTSKVEIDHMKYMEYSYEKGSKVMANLNLVKMSTLVYRIYVDVIAKGKVPWYLNYSDIITLFDTSILHAGANLRTNAALLSLIAVAVSRQNKDKTKFFRFEPSLQEGKRTMRPSFVPLNSVAYQTTNTTSKLLGAYFNEGLTSALTYPSEGKEESLEKLLRA